MQNAAAAPAEAKFGKDDHVTWDETMLSGDSIAPFIREYGEGPFRVFEVSEKNGRQMAQLQMPGGNAIRFEAAILKKVSLSSPPAEFRH